MQKSPSSSKALKKVAGFGVFGLKDVKPMGLSRLILNRWVKAGLIHHLERGLYIHPKSKLSPSLRDFATACKKFGPSSAIAGMSALSHYRLVEQVPTRVWVLVPASQKTTLRLYRLMRSKTNSQIGIHKHPYFRITSIERTLLDALRLQKKLGLRTVVSAFKRALSKKMTNERKLLETAKALGCVKLLEKYWEVIAP